MRLSGAPDRAGTTVFLEILIMQVSTECLKVYRKNVLHLLIYALQICSESWDAQYVALSMVGQQ